MTTIDRTGQYIKGTADARQVWGVLADDVVPALGAAGVYLSNHIIGSARFTDADTSGVYGIGTAYKAASGANAAEPVLTFPVAGGVIPDGQVWKAGAVFTVNGTAVPSGTTVSVGFYRVTVGGSGVITYTLSGTGKIVEAYGTGLAANTVNAAPTPDRRADFVSAGNQVYALGVELSAALPSGCVMDVSLSLQLS
jgi:hypothetical protein